MVSTMVFLAALVASTAMATAEQEAGNLPYTLGKPTFFGSGCPADTVAVVSSTDNKLISVLFSAFSSSTTPTRLRQYKACSLAVPLDLQPGFTVTITQVDYRGNAFVPNDAGSHADFSAEYFLAGTQGPQFTRSYEAGFNDNIIATDLAASTTWAPCGASTVFRINANVVAQKTAAGNGDVQIAIDSADGKLGGFRYKVDYKRC